MANYARVIAWLSWNDFFNRTADIDSFNGEHQQHYKVTDKRGYMLFLTRGHTGDPKVWSLDLQEVYEAFIHLDDFSAVAMKQYVPELPVVARDLLLCMGLLEVTD